MESLTIGQLAGQGGIGVETVRFYEREGLIDQPPRKASGYRQYPHETLSRIRFIRRAKQLGFTLKEIKELLALRLDPQTGCEDIRRRAEAKIADLEQRLLTLRAMKESLMRLTSACEGRGTVSECPILECLESEEPG